MGTASAIATDLDLRTDLSHEIRSRRFESQRNNSDTCAMHKNHFFARSTPRNIIAREPNSTFLTKTRRVVADGICARMARAACATRNRRARRLSSSKQATLGNIFQVRTFEICFTTSCVHVLQVVRSVHDELVCVQDCTTSVFRPAWFSENIVLLQPSGAPNRDRTVRGAKPSVRGPRLCGNDECVRQNM